MKKTIMTLGAIVALSFASYSQTVIRDAQGNYTAVKDSIRATARNTGNKLTDTKGQVYPVWVSKRGYKFVIVTSKSGEEYPNYTPFKAENDSTRKANAAQKVN